LYTHCTTSVMNSHSLFQVLPRCETVLSNMDVGSTLHKERIVHVMELLPADGAFPHPAIRYLPDKVSKRLTFIPDDVVSYYSSCLFSRYRSFSHRRFSLFYSSTSFTDKNIVAYHYGILACFTCLPCFPFRIRNCVFNYIVRNMKQWTIWHSCSDTVVPIQQAFQVHLFLFPHLARG
jgi:hypothetical protein